MSLASEYLASVIKRFQEYKTLGDKTFAQLSAEDFHRQPAEGSNSLALIIQHMHGNMLSRWTAFLTADGEKPWRQRDAEFETQGLSQDELLLRWEEGWATLFAALQSLTADDLLKTITIRSQPLIVVDAINRQLAHYSSHVGQIVYLSKWVLGGAWQSLSIARGGSAAYNQSLNKQ